MGKDHELLEASRNGNLPLVEKILIQKSKKSAFHSLRRGGGVNVQDNTGYTALHHASLNGHTDVVRLLLSNEDVCPNLLDSRGSSPLHLAAWAGHQDICKLLLTHPLSPADPNLQTADGNCALHFAAEHGHINALTTLLAHGANPNILNLRDESPLDLAAQFGRIHIVQILIRAHSELLLPLKCETTNCHHSTLHLASRNGHRDVVEVLLAAGCNVNLLTPNGTALHEAALCGKDNVVRVLLRANVDLDATDSDGRTVIDLLEQFPPHVTTRIMNVINHHRTSSIYDSESDDLRESGNRNYSFGSSSYDSSRNNWHHRYPYAQSQSHHSRSRQYQRYQEHYEAGGGGTTSPSSSMGSLGGPPSPPNRSGVYVAMKPIGSSSKPAPPVKPPRRTVSTSPPNQQQSMKLMSQSFDCSRNNSNNDLLDCSSSTSSNHHRTSNRNNNNNNHSKQRNTHEYLYYTQSAENDNNVNNDNNNKQHRERKSKQRQSVSSDLSDNYVVMNPITLPRNINYENNIVRVINPNRKLRRHKTDGGDNDTFIQIRRHPDEPPLSPTHYQQPKTPEHAPPSARHAERYIHERIRPLSQEYKRRSGKLDINDMASSPSDRHGHYLGASSGSLSSSVSLSSSTDCIEEYQGGDVPFAGLFKGSTMNLTLNNPNPNTFNLQQSSYQNYQQQQHQHQQRPTSLRTRTTSQSSDDEANRIQSTNNNNINANNSQQQQQQQQSQEKNNLNVLSPFDEQEEWAKISEIMASFGSGIVRESVFVNDMENEFKTRLGIKNSESANGSLLASPMVAEKPISPLKQWLQEIKFEHLEERLIENGFENIEFLNGIIVNDNDLLAIGVPEAEHQAFLAEIEKLSKPLTIMEMQQNNKLNNNQQQNGSLTVDQWLKSLQLEEYIDVFRRHLYLEMEKVYRVWEIELQAVLEIHKIGHRKRILHSLIGQRLEPPNIEEINNAGSSNDLSTTVQKQEVNEKVTETKAQSNGKPVPAAKPTTLSRHKKNRPAPQPPVKTNNLEIRAPSELLLAPTGLKAQWRHSASALVSGSIKYEVFYLGSTIIKELRGTESTRKSIQKLKRGERVLATSTSSSVNPSQQLVQNYKRPVCLAISHLGVQFIDIDTQGTICEHSVKNIDCACQDADDLSHFAYITKDLENNTHYCHVFNVDSMDLATEIILTLGQAFEVAYQLALRETSSTPLKSPSNSALIKRPMSAVSSTSTSDHG